MGLLACLLMSLPLDQGAPPRDPLEHFALGADLSFLRQAEEHGTVFKDQGIAKPGLQIFRDHGYNWIRLRLFVNPTELPNNLEYTIASAQAAKKLGYKFLLDFHYSDTWADPGHQHVPKAWAGLSHGELTRQVRSYSKESIQAFGKAGVLPDMVQVGNEIRVGMMWPDGRLPQNWDHFADLVRAGIQGVKEGAGKAPSPKIMLHVDSGGNKADTQWFFDKIAASKIKFDVIGQSYYPMWHGSLLDLRENLEFMAKAYKKDIIVVEVAYNWIPGEFIDRPGPFPESPEGQRQFLDEVTRLVLSTPGGHGKGVMWWEPAVEGPLRRRGMFGDDGNALPVLSVFDKFALPLPPGGQGN